VKQLINAILGRLGYVVHNKLYWQTIEKRIKDLEEMENNAERAHLKRTQLMAAKLERQRDDMAQQLAACQADLARLDTSGRTLALENEVKLLKRRLEDLETYLRKTRGEGVKYFL